MSIKLTSLLALALFAITAFAQTQKQPTEKPATALLAASTSCYATFNTALPNFCVTQNGNIENFVYPAGYSQIYTDGYGICDGTSGTLAGYYDIGTADSGNWQTSIVTEPGGANTFPLTIKRTTSDGIWTITQAFSRNTADAYVKVVITLKNNTPVARNVLVSRFVDIDADGQPNSNYFDGTANSGWGYNSAAASFPNHGLTIRSNSSVHNLFGYNLPWNAYNPCSPTLNALGAPTQGDEAVLYMWAPNGNLMIGPDKSITVTLEYRPM